MKQIELRLGNYVEYAGVISEVTGLDLDGILHTDSVSAPVNAFDEIPLTEEWLLRFGFEEKEFNGDHAVWGDAVPSSYSFELVSDSNGWWYYDRFGNGIKIEYVHSLQNLYWCLVGEELTLNK